ncbi:MAG: hypothetical protein JOZ47_05725 [Kutzneria sp.]|nr:hypothetical protein [Kutzneria sp.]
MSSTRWLARGALGLAAVAALSLAGVPIASARPADGTFNGTAGFDTPLTAGPFSNPIPQARIAIAFTENPLATHVTAEGCGTGARIGDVFIGGNDHRSTIVGQAAGANVCFTLRIQSNVPQADPFHVAGSVDYR